MSMYSNKIILAPMVRVNTLAFQLLAISYGAEMVYSEEIVDQKLKKTVRRVDAEKGIVQYVSIDDRGKEVKEAVVFSTLEQGSPGRAEIPVILQLGTACAETALAAALHVEDDVDGIDVNMGCPKRFSLQGGMGSALLREPERVRQILSTLVQGVHKPVTCKIRILEDDAATVHLLRTILDTGVAAVAIHPRLPNDRTEKVPADYARLKRILAEVGDVKVPIILSGDVMDRFQAEAAREATGASSVMIARGAMWNASAFGMAPVHKLQYAQQYLWYSLYYGNAMGTAKYVLTRSFQTEGKAWLPIFERLQAARTLEDLCVACGLAPDPKFAAERPPPGPAIGWLGPPPACVAFPPTPALTSNGRCAARPPNPSHGSPGGAAAQPEEGRKTLARTPDSAEEEAAAAPKRLKGDAASAANPDPLTPARAVLR
eukprot:EG_transcript_12469